MKTVRIGLLIVLSGMLVRLGALAQGVSIGTELAGPPEASALLDLNVSGFTEKKGLLIPRMTESEKLEITSPATSLLVYQTNGTEGYYYYDGSQWVTFGGSTDDLGNHTASSNIELSGNWISGDGGDEGISIDNAGNVGVGVASPLASFHAAGTVLMNDLAGSGNRMVVADENGQLSTQAIPTAPGSGSTLNIHLTNNVSNIDVTGVSFIYFTTDDDHEIRGFQGGVQNQIIYLANPEDEDDIKFKKNNGMQKFLKDFDLKEEEGAIVMYTGSNWITISKH